MMQNDHFDHMTEDARRVLNRAREEAQRFHHPNIGVAHLLLGLISEEQGTAARVLQSQGVKLAEARIFVVRSFGQSGRGEQLMQGELPLTPRAEIAMAQAAEEAQRMNQPLIGTEHLLLGLVRAGGIATDFLESLGISLEQLRTATTQLTSGAMPVTQEREWPRGRKPIKHTRIVRMRVMPEEV